MSDTSLPHGLHPTRLLRPCPWDFSDGKLFIRLFGVLISFADSQCLPAVVKIIVTTLAMHHTGQLDFTSFYKII